jgi:hypothetical protein
MIRCYRFSITPAPPDSLLCSLRERPGTEDGGPGLRDRENPAAGELIR